MTRVLLAGIFRVGLWTLFFTADIVFEDKKLSFDDPIFSTIHHSIHAENTGLMETTTILGSSFYLLPGNFALSFFCFDKIAEIHRLKKSPPFP